LETTPPHAVGNQVAFVFGNSPSNLQQQLIVRILAHRSLDKLDLAPAFFQFLNQEHLVDILTSQPIWSRHQHAIKVRLSYLITETVESWSLETGPAVAIGTYHAVISPFPSLQLKMGLESLQLLVNGLHLCLTLGGYANVDSYSHLTPPVVLSQSRLTTLDTWSNSADTGTLDPNGAGHLDVLQAGVWSSTGVVS
jgi:hypothetical protein